MICVQILYRNNFGYVYQKFSRNFFETFAEKFAIVYQKLSGKSSGKFFGHFVGCIGILFRTFLGSGAGLARLKVLPAMPRLFVGGFTTRHHKPGSKAARFSSYLYHRKWEGHRCSLFSGVIILINLLVARVFDRRYVPVLVVGFTGKFFATACRIFIDHAI